MGFYTRIPEAAPPPPYLMSSLTSEVEKKYFILDKIDINYVMSNDTEEINIDVKLNIYDSYEERLVRGNLLTSMEFSIQNLINKNFSENLWTTCYVKIKELILNQNIQCLKEALRLSDSDTIPSQYQYLLEIDDHFN